MGGISRREYLKYTGVGLTALTVVVGGKLASDSARSGASEGARTRSADPAERAPANPVWRGEKESGPGVLAGPQEDTGSGTPLVTGGVQPGTALEFDRADDGDVEFWWGGVEFESSDGDRDVEFLVDDGDLYIDFESTVSGDDLELTILVAGDGIDLDVYQDDEVEVTTIGGPHSFEHDRGRIEYVGPLLRVEWDPRRHELEVRGAVHLDWDGDEFEYRGRTVRIDWEATTPERTGTFEARAV
ncbi:hypothetical protein [Haloarchaeobius sp. DYHT-AS-18]|uniref:hypothetical protein n=1 Tax=Haloarchaeobius sp. DYHT-AS-18 TaxID=3446117 RepID=UPI003EB9780F